MSAPDELAGLPGDIYDGVFDVTAPSDLPEGIDIELGEYIKVQECRPLSKIIHFMVLGKATKEASK